MDKFWQFARMLLHYRGLLLLAAAGVLLDAACVLGGYGTLSWVIQQFFKEQATIHTLATDGLTKIRDLNTWYGVDLTRLLDYIPRGPITGLAFALGVIMAFALLGSAGRFIHESSTITASMRTVMRIRKMVFMRLVHLPLLSALSGSTAESVSKVVRDTRQLAAGFSALTSRAVRGVVIGLAMLGLAFAKDWQLVMIFMVVIPPIALLVRKFGKRIRRASKWTLREYGVMMGALTESLQALRVVKVHHAEGYERRRFNRINRRLLAATLRARTTKAIAAPVIETLSMLGVMVVVLAAAWLVYQPPEGAGPKREPEDLVIVMMYLVVSAGAFRTLSGMNNSLQEAAAAAESIDELLRVPIEQTPRSGAERRLPALPRHRRSVAFERVSFTYPGASTPALRGVSFDTQHGAVCAIVGSNGSGKSTLLGLLPRLYEPTSGRVLIDGTDIAGCTLRSVRRQIAVVTQETVLFDGTVEENIRYGSRHADEERVIDAARRAHAHGFIAQLPQGYRTEVGERGQRLSGGQRQRIAIARAILRDPAILILDEATSQIDAESEAQINEALAEFTAGRTTFVIAHRLSTVVHADMIVVMADGAVASIGRHEELLKTSDVYRVLCRTQLHSMETMTNDQAPMTNVQT